MEKRLSNRKLEVAWSTAAPDFGTLISSVIATLHLATVELLLLNIFPIASEFFFFKGRFSGVVVVVVVQLLVKSTISVSES